MWRRGVCAAALAVWLVAVVGLRAATSDVEISRVVLETGVPGVLYTPRAPVGGALPLAILCHDFAGNAGQLGYLARHLARAGWAALALDLRGHGRNLARFDDDGANRALARDLEAALEWVVGYPRRLDPSRVALVGHGMGARAALQQAQWNPSAVASLVALAPSRDVSGPYAAPSTLVLWGNRDRALVRAAGRAIGARLAGRVQITGESTYGDPEHGDAVRIAELTGPGHWSLLWSEATATRVVEWLRLTAADPTAADATEALPPAERTLGWALLGWLAFAVVLWELPRMLSPLWLPDLAAARASLALRGAAVFGSLLAAGALVAATPAEELLEPLGLAGAREPLALLGVSGSAALLLLPRDWSGTALRRGGTWLGAAALAAAFYLFSGPLLAAWLDPWPAPGRLAVIALASAAALPHFAALECLLRAPGWLGAVLPAAGRLFAIALLASLALAGFLPDASLTAARLLLLGAPLLELAAQRLARGGAGPWLPALAQSLWVGWVFGALFPRDF